MLNVACKNDNFVYLLFLITSPHPSFNSFSEHYSEAVRNIMLLGRITEQVSAKSCMQE